MPKIFTAVALAGALSLPLVTGAALAQSAAPEPPHGATPGDAGTGAGAGKGDMPASPKKVKKTSTKKHK